jgi:fructose-1,6-bisphosphatase II
MAEPIERNLGLDLVRVTETAALGAARWLGRGDKEAVDQAAVDGMRLHLSTLDIDGIVVIGEGEKDEAPMLYNGERVVDVAVDPIDGTTLTAHGLPGAITVIAIAEGRGTMYDPGPFVYMDKIAVGPDAAGLIDLDAPIADNLKKIAKARGKEIGELRCLILDRDRNRRHIEEVRAVGARISLFRDGDVAAAIATAEDDEEVDVMLGIGGSPEAVIAAAALKCMGGEIQCRLWARNEEEKLRAQDMGTDLTRVLTTNDLVSSDNVFFAATGVTGGEFLKPVVFTGSDHATTHSVIMRSKTGSIRYMEAKHDLRRLRELSEDGILD